MESQEFEMILGRIQPDGTRKPGAVDRFKTRKSEAMVKFQAATSEVIRSVAQGAEERGLYEDAVRLYDLAEVFHWMCVFVWAGSYNMFSSKNFMSLKVYLCSLAMEAVYRKCFSTCSVVKFLLYCL